MSTVQLSTRSFEARRCSRGAAVPISSVSAATRMHSAARSCLGRLPSSANSHQRANGVCAAGGLRPNAIIRIRKASQLSDSACATSEPAVSMRPDRPSKRPRSLPSWRSAGQLLLGGEPAGLYLCRTGTERAGLRASMPRVDGRSTSLASRTTRVMVSRCASVIGTKRRRIRSRQSRERSGAGARRASSCCLGRARARRCRVHVRTDSGARPL